MGVACSKLNMRSLGIIASHACTSEGTSYHSMHWSDFNRWILVEYMFNLVKDAIMVREHVVPYIALSCDEVTSVDDGSWFCVHGYYIVNEIGMLVLLGLEKIL
jgi:hypothetical protein